LGNASVANVATVGTITADAVTYPKAHGTNGQVLSTTGSGTLTWITPSTTATAYNGILPVANGGTGVATLTGYIKGTGTSAMTASASIPVADVLGAAPLASPTFTGTPAAPTATAGTNTTQVATTAFVTNAVSTATGGTFVDLTTNQTVAGAKTFSSDLTVNGMIIGKGPGADNISSTAIGFGALRGNTDSGNTNTAVGAKSQYSPNLSGASNTSLGAATLYVNQAGNSNTAVGSYSLYLNQGSDNTAIGQGSLLNNVNGARNTALGKGAGTGTLPDLENTTAIGYGAIVDANDKIQLGNASVTNVSTAGTLTAGDVTYPNTHNAIAGQVLTTDGTGVASWADAISSGVPYTGANAAVNLGSYDLRVQNLTVGLGNGSNSNNTAFGSLALASNHPTAEKNSAIGKFALYSNSTGLNNTGLGYFAGKSNIVGSNNTSIGAFAMENSTGYDNTAIGYKALLSNSAGNDNTAIGYQANVASGALTNATAIGSGAIVSASNTIQLGADGTSYTLNGDTYPSTAITKVKTSGTLTLKDVTYPNTHRSTAGDVLTINSSGTASWLPVSVSAGTLTGTTLKSTVTGSSLTSVGTLTSATINGKVVVGASSAASSSAILEASSTTQGFLPPRMTYAQREAITSPATGLVIFCTNCGPASIGGELEVYSGGMWRNMTGTAAATPAALVNIGDSYLGGKVAYILQSGDPGYDPSFQHGLIAAISDHPVRIQWSNGSDITTGATATALGTGFANTNTIIAAQGTGSYAASVARNHTGGGYTDWYLPSKDELYKLWLNRTAIGNFNGDWYYSSSENNVSTAWLINGSSGSWWQQVKGEAWHVRAVRAF
jgi:hypothetical protein